MDDRVRDAGSKMRGTGRAAVPVAFAAALVAAALVAPHGAVADVYPPPPRHSSASSDMHFDEQRFEQDFTAVPEPGSHDARVGPGLLLLRLHPGREGFRPFVDAGGGIMDVSRPAIFYTDGSGTLQTFLGAEIFGFDWCYSAGAGIEWTWYRRAFGAAVETRFVNAPGRTKPPHTIATLRAGVQYTLPRIMLTSHAP